MTVKDFFILVDTKARMALKAENSKLYLSFLWWIIEPLFFVSAYYFVFSTIMGGREPNFLVFLMCAKVPFMWFSKSLTNASTSIVSGRGIISQLHISKAIFPYASIQISLYKEIPVFLLLLAMCFYFGYYPTLEWLWLAPLLLVLYLMIISTGMLAALICCYIDDIRILINMVMMLLMFVSGIFYDIGNIHQPVQSYLLALNPIAFFCDAFRKILMNKGMFSTFHLGALFIIFASLTAIMHLVYQRASKGIAARVVSI